MKQETTRLKIVIAAAFVCTLAIAPLIMEAPAALAVSSPAYNKNGHTQKHPEIFTGSVIMVHSNQRFDIRAGTTTYKVKTASPLPYTLGKGDIVRVSGLGSGNSITYARVEILRKSARNNSNQDESFTGIITKINSTRKFDIRINGKLFNVNTAGNLPSYLKKGDKVRVTGRRFGINDIDNARVIRLSDH